MARNKPISYGPHSKEKIIRKRSSAKIASINRLIVEFGSLNDLENILDKVLRAALELSKASEAAIYLTDEDAGDVYERAYLGENTDQARIHRQRSNDSLIGEVIKSKQISNINYDTKLATNHLVKSLLAVPLVFQGQSIGALCIWNRNKGQTFSDDDELSILALADYAAIALQNSRLLSDAYKTVESLRAIHRVSDSLLQFSDLDQLLEIITEKAREILSADIVVLFKVADRNDILATPPLVSGKLINPASFIFGEVIPKGGLVSKMLLRKTPFYAPNASHDWSEERLYEPFESTRQTFIDRENIVSSAGIPLLIENKGVGVLFVNYRSPVTFSDAKRLTIETFANQAAIAIRNTQRIVDTQKIASQRVALANIAQKISRSVIWDLNEIFDLVYRECAPLMNVENLFIALYDEVDDRIKFRYVKEDGRDGSDSEEWADRKHGKGLSEYIIRHKEPILISSNAEEWLKSHDILPIGKPAKSWLGVPMLTNRKILGVIAVQDYLRENAFLNEHLEILSTIASQTAAALERAQLYSQELKKSVELGALHKLSEKIAAKGDISARLESIVAAAAELLHAKGGKIYLKVPGQELLELKAITGIKRGTYPIGSKLSPGKGLTGQVVASKKPMIVDDYSIYEHRIPQLEAIFVSVIEIPLLVNDDPVGALAVFDTSQKKRFTEADVPTLERFACYAILASFDVQVVSHQKRQLERLRILHDASILAQKKTGNFYSDLSELAVHSLQLLGHDAAPLARCSISLISPEKKLIEVATAPDLSTGFQPVDLNLGIDSIISLRGRAAIAGNTLISNQAMQEVGTNGSEIAVPIKIEGIVSGVINLTHPMNGLFDQELQQALEILASDVASAIQGHQVLQVMEQAREEEREIAAATLNDTTQTFVGKYYFDEIVHDLRHILGQMKLTTYRLLEEPSLKKLPARTNKEILNLCKRMDESYIAMKEFLDNIEEEEETFSSQDLNRIILQVVRLNHGRLQDASVEVDDSQLQKDLPPVYANRMQIITVLFNLISNATDSLLQVNRTRRIIIATKEIPSERAVQVIVNDNGLGISPEHRSRIFEPRFTTKQVRGRGLGLYGSKRLITNMKGSISFSSDYGKGATFVITLPKS